jgi:hypothetical protein
MPGDQYVAVSEAINLAAGTPGTIGNSIVLDVASTGAARRMNCNEIGVSFNGTSSSATPVTVRLVRCTVAPSGGGAITQAPTPLDSAAPSSTFTAYQPSSASPGVYSTTAPTVGVYLRSWYVSPTSGLVVQFPLGQEPDGPATTAAGLGIQCIAPATVQVNSYMIWTE